MSIAVRPGTAVGAVHMHLVYFGSVEQDDGPREHGPVLPGELTRVFHQLELLLNYAPRVTAAEDIPAAASPVDLMEAVKRSLGAFRERAGAADDKTESDPRAEPVLEVRSSFEGLIVSISHVDNPGGPAAGPGTSQDAAPLVAAQSPSVIALRMDSPLEILVQVPVAGWPVLGIGLIALTERIATMPVRITRKWKQERLKSAVLDKQTQAVISTRADVFARLLLENGPARDHSGPHEVTFLDPDDPGGELEPATIIQPA